MEEAGDALCTCVFENRIGAHCFFVCRVRTVDSRAFFKSLFQTVFRPARSVAIVQLLLADLVHKAQGASLLAPIDLCNFTIIQLLRVPLLPEV
jgi:hypothetical protein